MSKYIVEFGTSVKKVIAEGRSKKEAGEDAWFQYDESREWNTGENIREIIIKSIKKITK